MTMRPLMSSWTDRHSSVALLVLFASGACLTGLLDGGWVPWAMPVGVVATVVVSLALDSWGGAAVGLAAAAAVVALRRSFGAWRPEDFAPATVAVVALVLLGAIAGWVGRQLRQGAARPGGSTEPMWGPAHGSMGLLGPSVALLRLAEEIGRAGRTRRPLTLVLLDAELTDPSLPPEEHKAALRATARLVENRAREYDVPFALSPDRLGIVLPDSAASEAWEVVAQVLGALGAATFPQGEQRVPQRLADTITLHAGIAQHRHGQTWEALLDEATSALTRARNDEASPLSGERDHR